MKAITSSFDPAVFLTLFEESSDAVYIKNQAGEFLFSNGAHRQLMGVQGNDQIIGKTDFDFILPFLAIRFQIQDREVFKGSPLMKQIELLSKEGDHSSWQRTTKLPLRTRQGKIMGLIGYTQKLAQEDLRLMVSAEISRALDYLQDNFSEQIKMPTLAKITCLSVSALERRFQKEVGMSPTAYLKNIRINEACRRLAESQETISKVALESGFCDQSYFTAEFRKHFEITPLQYRKGFLNYRN